MQTIGQTMQLHPYFEWRGLGLRPEYAKWDAEGQFVVEGLRVTDPKAAECGEVLKGVLKPPRYKLFDKECTPEQPVRALMVSSEGACPAYYNFFQSPQASAADD